MIEKNVKLWLGDGPLIRVPVSQFDTAWRFVFSIIYNSVEWTIPTGATAVLNGKKPDGNVFAFSGTISNNTVTVDTDVQMTAVAGDTICELSILVDGKTVGTANFTLAVESAPKSPDDVSSDSTIPAYAEMLEMFSGDITNAVDDWLDDHGGEIGSLTDQAKQALLTLLGHVYFDDDHGPEYIEDLRSALYPPTSITAVSTQGSAVIYNTDTLDTLRQYLTVTANYSEGVTEVVDAYVLSGTLTVGTSTITATYGGKSDTFDVTVTKQPNGLVDGTYSGNISTTKATVSSNRITWGDSLTNYARVDVPLQHPVVVSTGDVVRLTTSNPNPSDGSKMGANVQLNGEGSSIVLTPYYTDPYSKSITVQESVTVTFLRFVLQSPNQGGREFDMTMYINNEEVFA